MHFDRRVRTRHVHSREKCGVLLHTPLHTSVELSLFHRSVEFIHLKVWSFFISHSVCTITTHFLCHYKLSHCLPIIVLLNVYLPVGLIVCPIACGLYLWLPVCVSFCLFVCPLSSCLFICLPARMPVCLFFCMYIYLSLFARLCFFLSVCLSVCLPVCFPAFMSAVCPFACVSVLLRRSMIKSSCVDSYVVFSHELFHYFVRTEN